MKTYFKLIFKKLTLSLLFLFSFLSFSFAQPYTATVTVNYNNSSLTPVSSISVPIKIDAQSQVYGYDLNITYNKEVLTYTSFTFVYPAGQAANMGVVSTSTGVTLSFLPSGTTNYPYADQVVCDLNFTFNGGSTAITPSLVDMFDVDFNMFTITPVAGSASGSYGDITSVAAGGNWGNITTWDLGHLPNSSNGNVIINSSTNPVTVASVAWARNVIINSGKYLTASGTFSVGGTFTINDGGSFIDNNSNSLTASVQRVMTGNWTSGSPDAGTVWHAIYPPVQNALYNVFEGSLMNSWNEVTQFWDPITWPSNVAMPSGKGFIVAPLSPGITATFSGTLNTGNQTISGLTKSGGTWTGFNLIGNPFASAIQWNTGISVTNVANYAWVWNGGAYISLDRTIGTGVIPAEQGFFVQVSTGTGSVTMPTANRVHSAQAYYKSGISDLLTLKVEGNGYWDQTQVRILSGSSETYNIDYDALKFQGSDAAPQLNSYKKDVELSILSLPSLSVYPVVMLGFKPGTAGNFTITASDLETFASGTNVYLEDLLTGNKQDLNVNPVYSFNAVAGQPYHRFNLHFAALGVPEAKGSDIHIYSNEKTIYVNIPSVMNGDIVVYNIMGVEIARKQISGNSLNKLNTNLNTGYYIVKVLGDTQSVANKVFIR